MRLERDPARPLLLDGAMGTELIARGFKVREECPEAWNLDRPDEVRAVHAAYAQVGADAVQTNTFGCIRPRLKRFNRAAQVVELARAAVKLAREAAPGRYVIGSLGPSGETVPLSGAEVGWLEEAYAEAAQALALAGVDALHLETMFHPAELTAALRGVRAGAPSLPVVASMALMAGASGLETPHAVPLAKMLKALEPEPPDAVGANCAIDAERMKPVIEQLRAASTLPVWAKPQARMSEKCATGRSSETPDQFARRALELTLAGAAAVGGCCGTGPAAILTLRRLLDAHHREKAAS
jgi:5-methyltetrahydrofolate--homocysteine methyltransferase